MNNLPTQAQHKLENLKQAARDSDALAKAASDSAKTDRLKVAEAARMALNNVEVFLQQNSGKHFDLASAGKVPLRKNETPLQAVERVRKSINETRVKLRNAQMARLSDVELKAQAETYVDEMGKRAAPSLGTDLAKGLQVQVNDFHKPVGQPGSDIRASERALGLLCWCMPDQVLAAIHADIDRLPGNGVDSVTKSEVVAELQSELLTLERDEEAIICKAAESGQIIPRRFDASPLAVLGIQFGAKAKAA